MDESEREGTKWTCEREREGEKRDTGKERLGSRTHDGMNAWTWMAFGERPCVFFSLSVNRIALDVCLIHYLVHAEIARDTNRHARF